MPLRYLGLFLLAAIGFTLRAARPSADLTTIRGAFELPDGRPAVGVALELHGWLSSSERLAEHGSPAKWDDLHATSSNAGEVEIRFDAPPAFQFTLDAKQGGYAVDSWRWGELKAGATIDLGVVKLRPGGSVTGRVLAADRTPLHVNSHVHVDVPPGSDAGPDRVSRRVYAAPTGPGSPAFRIDDLPAGTHRLELLIIGGPDFAGPQITVVTGQTTTADIVYDGAVLSSTLELGINTNPVYWAYPRLSSFVLIGPAGERLTPSADPSGRGVFRGLGPGPYSLRVDDPSFEPLELRELHPGPNYVRVHLVGRSALAVNVFDDMSHARVDRFDAVLRLAPGTFPIEEHPWEGAHLQPGSSGGHAFTFTLLRATEAPAADHVIRAIPPGSYTLIVKVADRAPQFVEVSRLLAAETRALDVHVKPGGTLGGRVTVSDGTAAPSDITLFAAGEENLPALGHFVVGRELTPFEKAMCAGMGYERARAESDSDGRFSVANIDAGEYVVRASAKGKLLQGESRITVVDGATSEVGVVVTELPSPFEKRSRK